MPVDLTTLGFLVCAAFCAGFVDSIAGGGGLIALPSLLLTGIPPVEAVATNKLQSTFGTAMASWRYWKEGLVDLRDLRFAVVMTAIASAFGGYALRLIDPRLLNVLIPVMLIVIAGYFAFGHKATEEDRHARLTPEAFALAVAIPIGFYDGIFGPGTGSFFAAAFVMLAGHNLLKATAHTKILNLTSNLGGLAVFIASGQVIFPIGLAMAVGQTLGARLGSSLAINHGAALIRPLIVVVSCAIALRLLLK